MNELSEACERLRPFANEQPTIEAQGVRDMWLLDRAYLVEHPADEELPIDEEFLLSLGFVRYGKYTGLEIAMPTPVAGFRNVLRVDDSDGLAPLNFAEALWCVWNYETSSEGREGATIGRGLAQTRGELRALLRVLKIPLPPEQP